MKPVILTSSSVSGQFGWRCVTGGIFFNHAAGGWHSGWKLFGQKGNWLHLRPAEKWSPFILIKLHVFVCVYVCVPARTSACNSFHWIVPFLKRSSSDLPDLVEAPPLESQTACRTAVVKMTQMLFNERLSRTEQVMSLNQCQ